MRLPTQRSGRRSSAPGDALPYVAQLAVGEGLVVVEVHLAQLRLKQIDGGVLPGTVATGDTSFRGSKRWE